MGERGVYFTLDFFEVASSQESGTQHHHETALTLPANTTFVHLVTHSSPTTCVSPPLPAIPISGISVPSVCNCFLSTRSALYIL